MPIYHHFYVEQHGADGWGLPPGLEFHPFTFECDQRFGGFAWAHPRSGWLGLFWGPDALFAMREGPPDDRRGSPLLQRYVDWSYDFRRNEDALCWIPYTELLVDSWETDLLLVRAPVSAGYALLFGDGRQRFPSAELLDAGASDAELRRLARRSLAHEPINIIFGKQRSLVAELPPDRPINVTWRETISEFIGEPHAGLFRGLRQYGRDADLRILSRRG